MKEWQKILVLPTATILDTMRLIDREASQFAVVVTPDDRLLGTVTDGDIRRGLLNGIELTGLVEQIMNDNPVVAKESEINSSINDIFYKKKVRQLPIINNENKVINVLFSDSLNAVIKKPNKVVLMAGGLGTRLRPLTNDIPKPLLKVGDKPILHTIIDGFKRYGFTDILLSVNYKSDAIKDYFQDGSHLGVNIKYIDETKKLGTAGALSLIEEELTDPFFVMNGDLLTTINYEQLLNFHKHHQSNATMCVREYEYQIPFGVIETQDDRLLNIKEKPLHKEFVNAGIYVLDPKLLNFVPENEFFDMPDLFLKALEKNYKSSVFPLREYWLDIGRYDDYERANKEYYEVF